MKRGGGRNKKKEEESGRGRNGRRKERKLRGRSRMRIGKRSGAELLILHRTSVGNVGPNQGAGSSWYLSCGPTVDLKLPREHHS